ncbi:putative pentatricopeptide repeat-containing protein, mitochondrial [Sesamum angolense]|uniref:Pentatricopeptide repeat-containing protein, mitochondrial n=1 Tax=Sesamum angolense TaxID=2727404 RepID=A0AAE1WLN2_9LAMI|nr:putative pentatricopeptide repeat-containing protein, mitochondrial [Sesamum angolense]
MMEEALKGEPSCMIALRIFQILQRIMIQMTSLIRVRALRSDRNRVDANPIYHIPERSRRKLSQQNKSKTAGEKPPRHLQTPEMSSVQFAKNFPELQELSSKLTPEIVETVLKSFRNWRLAQVFFSWASKQEGYSHSCYTYNALAAVLSNARQITPLRELAESILISQCLWTPGAFGYFLSYNCLLEVISNSGDVGLLEYRLNEMRDFGCPMDKHSLTPALQCYCSAKMFDKALMVFNELNERGWVDQHVLAILLVSYSKCGEVDMAFELIEWAERNLKISLNEKTLCVFDTWNREMGKALMLYMHMKESGISPDVQIVSQLLSCLVNGGNVDKAYHLLRATMVSGLNVSSQADKIVLIKEKPDTTCFQTVMDGLCKADKLDMALDLFHDMHRNGCGRSVLLFNNLIYCLSNADRLNECFDLLNKMKETELQPTHFTFNCILGCLCRREDVVGALSLLREMRIRGHEPWIKNYTLLVKKLCEHGKAIEARSFLADMTKEGFLPDMIAYSATIDGFLNINELDQALKLFREICERGYCPDVVAYNTIIKGLCKAKRITEAEDVLNEIFGKGLVPSVITYNLLIDGWCKNGDTDQAVLWFSRMIDKELEPNVITYTTLIDGLCNAGKSDEALTYGLKWRIRDKMEEKEMLPDSYIYRALIDAFAANSNTAMAHEVLEKMIKRGPGAYLLILFRVLFIDCGPGSFLANFLVFIAAPTLASKWYSALFVCVCCVMVTESDPYVADLKPHDPESCPITSFYLSYFNGLNSVNWLAFNGHLMDRFNLLLLKPHIGRPNRMLIQIHKLHIADTIFESVMERHIKHISHTTLAVAGFFADVKNAEHDDVVEDDFVSSFLVNAALQRLTAASSSKRTNLIILKEIRGMPTKIVMATERMVSTIITISVPKSLFHPTMKMMMMMSSKAMIKMANVVGT